MRTVLATRYVTPLREGGSLPAIVEGEDAGLYVMKFRGAGQGLRALLAEVISGLLGQALGLAVPELVLLTLDPALARNEPDEEIRDLLKASIGLNMGLDYLPGSVTFDPLAGAAPDAQLASEVVWFDAFITNVDRTAKNPNLLSWHRKLWLIDHGASLYFHHTWQDYLGKSQTPFPQVRDHVLLPFASRLREAHTRLRPLLDEALLHRVLGKVPDAWLGEHVPFHSAAEHRAAYVAYLKARADSSTLFVEEALRVRASLV